MGDPSNISKYWSKYVQSPMFMEFDVHGVRTDERRPMTEDVVDKAQSTRTYLMWIVVPVFFQKPGNEGANKLYDMGDEPDRRSFLDKLFAYMDDKGSPITAMPTISKQPIDLFKLYVLVKEKGGIVEVSKVPNLKCLVQSIFKIVSVIPNG